MSTFIVFGDAHFGSGEHYGAQPGERLRDQRAALEMVVDVAIDSNADALLFAGDAFEGPLVTPEQYEAFRAPLRRLAEAGIPAVGISGNGRHDCAMRTVNALQVVGDLMDVYREPALVEIAGVHIALLPWASNSRLVAARNGGGDRDTTNSEVAALVLQIARGLHARIPTGKPSLLLGHWSLTGAHLPNGLPVDDLREPVLETSELESIGFNLCAFGHIHVPGPIAETVLYTGPLATTSFGEAGVEHGCWRITFSADVFEGMEWDFIELGERTFVTVDADLTSDAARIEVTTPEDGYDKRIDLNETDFVIAMALEHTLSDAVVRVRYRATEEQARRIDHHEISKALYDAGAHKVFAIQPDIVRADRARVAGVDEDLDTLAALDLWFESEVIDGWLRDELRTLSARYLEEVGA